MELFLFIWLMFIVGCLIGIGFELNFLNKNIEKLIEVIEDKK